MDALIELSENPIPNERFLIAGWRQWADAGNVSSALPQYLVDKIGARPVARMQSDPFYLFQIPGTQHLLRPEGKLQEGSLTDLVRKKNELFLSDAVPSLAIFLGDEPQVRVERYAQAFFDLVKELNVKRVAAVGGVYAAVPYDKDRHISCTFSLPRMKQELADYAVQFSSYSGGATIGLYLIDRAEQLGVEFVDLYAMVPMYDFSVISPLVEPISIGSDYKAWYDVMRRLSYMFTLGLDLSELEDKSRDLVDTVAAEIKGMEKKVPAAKVKEYFDKVNADFTETSFLPLDDVWQTGLKDIFKDTE